MKIINEDASRPLNQELVKFIMKNEFTEEDIKNALTVVKSSRESWDKLSGTFSSNKGPNSFPTPDSHSEMLDYFGENEDVVVGVGGDPDDHSSDTICVFVDYSEESPALVSEFSYSKGELPEAIDLANELSSKFSEDYSKENVVKVCKSLGMTEE